MERYSETDTLLANAIRDYGQNGNVTLDEALVQYYDQGIITMETVRRYCHDPEEITRLITSMIVHSRKVYSKS